MSDLKDLLQSAGEAKRQLFASEDFAVGYGRSVVSRVKRRRVASATAMGGGTVVAVGALAVAVTHVPFASLGLAASGHAVICTTTTPDAVANSSSSAPSKDPDLSVTEASHGTSDYPSWLVLDDVGTPIARVESDGNGLTFVFTDGDVQRYPIGDVGNYGVKLPDGQEVVFAFDGALTYVGASTAASAPSADNALSLSGHSSPVGSAMWPWSWAARILRTSWRISPWTLIPTR